jgi:dienelactone hydrolase
MWCSQGASRHWRARLAGAVLLAGCSGSALAAGSAPSPRPPLPIEAFFQPAAARGAELSPSGHRLAMIRAGEDGESVVVVDLRSHAEAVALVAGKGEHFGWVRWKGEGRLLAGSAADGPGDEPEDVSPGRRVDETVTAVDTDGAHALVLIKGERPHFGGPAATRLSDTEAVDPAHVLALAPNSRGGEGLWRLDVDSGERTLVSETAPDTAERLPASALMVREGARAKASEPRWARGKVQPAGLAILGPAAGPDRVYALGHGEEGATVRVYDFRTQAMSEPVWPAIRADVSEIVYGERDKALAGVCTSAEVFGCEFRDPLLQADYRRAAHDLGEGRSLTPVSMSQDGRWWLFGVSAPQQRGTYWLMDRTTKKLTLVADRYPGLPADRLGRREPYVYTARDGTRIPGYLTRPPGAAEKNLPLLVMPHGGPEARDNLTYDRWSQVFATRGYLVFQPNFRGSTGYGPAWSQAGYRQWGGLMQDDLTDGVKSLVADGRADPSRICIMGASYGGYAALYGGATQPDLYRCVVSWAGVSDLAALVQGERKAHGASSARYLYARTIIGDPRTEKARLQKASPITYASTYRPPVLLLHGSHDEAVPVEQSRRMAAAIRASGGRVSLTVAPEGHVEWSEANETAALAEIAAFLDRNIGGPAA